jgi:short-subunit dehydrogenase
MSEKGSALIVGVGPGLGVAVARAFAAAGHPVGLVGRTGATLKELAGQLQAEGHVARDYQADAADAAQLGSALDAAVAELGAPEVLVYNAAYGRPDTPTAVSPEAWADSLAVNVIGATVASGHVIPAFRGGRGTVLFTGGGFAVAPSPDYTTLSVGKAALRAYALALHEEQRDAGVHVTTVTIRGFISPGDGRFAPAAIAEVYLELHRRPRDQWQAEYVYA